MPAPWPPRVNVALLCFAANILAHSDRVALSVALPVMMRQYGWDTARSGWVLSGFFVGYVALMIPVGLLVQRFGPRKVFAACVALWSVCSIATPLARSAQSLTAIRVLLGAFESGTAACINSTLVRWFPVTEYSRAAGLCWSGGYAGPVLAVPLASLLLHQFGWPAIFYTFGALGLTWLPMWWRNAEKPLSTGSASRIAPPVRLLISPPVVAIMLLHFSSNWVLYFMITWLPAYLSFERKMSLSGTAAGASLPFVFAWLGTNLFGWAIDRLSLHWGRTPTRKLFMIPYAAAAVALLLVPHAATPAGAVAILCLVMALMTSATPVFSSASMDLAPDMAGPLASIQSAFANIAGIVAPVAAGYLVKAFGWASPFALTAGIALLGVAVYARYGSAGRADRF
ncbi:MAG: MFS transporter [Bryobacterales bacterium]|nr:MFS transporter [Bryobacterales bacterium]